MSDGWATYRPEYRPYVPPALAASGMNMDAIQSDGAGQRAKGAPSTAGTAAVPNVIGLDLSLTMTGVATETGTFAIRCGNERGMARLATVRNRVIGVVSRNGWADLVVIEGYSMGTARQSSHAHGLGELGGVVRLVLWEAGVTYVDVPPACLKKYATGAGNARKEAVLIAAVKRGAEVQDNNEADAWWLRAMGMDALGSPLVVVPQLHRKALTTVAWPLAPTALSG